VPAIAGFVTLQPNSFARISAGVTQSVRLTFSVPAGTPFGKKKGAIHLRTGSQALPQTLKLLINVWPSITSGGLAVRYPPTWHVDARLLAVGGHVLLTTMTNGLNQGGVVPTGGAEIDITATPFGRTDLDNAITNDLRGLSIQSKEAISVAASGATKVSYREELTPTIVTGNVAVYIPRAARLYKLFLSYNAGDPLEAQFLGDFERILNGIYFVE
jgi:hypothetical protein